MSHIMYLVMNVVAAFEPAEEREREKELGSIFIWYSQYLKHEEIHLDTIGRGKKISVLQGA